MIEIITKSEEETKKVGELLAKTLKGGEVLCLEGDLGAGKTTFVQGLAKGLRVKEWPRSPTFVIMRNYQLPTTNYELIHIDCYRLKDPEDLLRLGFKEIINSENIVVIEWADKARKILPNNCLRIKFEFLGENERKIIVKC
jgi:tRNA threonylcarbamoyladenosine biosynthesis protein TsaE